MPTKGRLLRATAVLGAVAALLVSACGSDSGSGSGTDDVSSASMCTGGTQTLPTTQCDAATHTCYGAAVPSDKDACTQCLDTAKQLGMTTDQLTQCACNNCAIQLGACFQSATREMNGSADRDTKCRAVVECGLRTGCAGTDCYCGTGMTIAECLTSATTAPQGPCAQEIATAAGCTLNDPVCVATAQADPLSAVGRAFSVAQCTTGDPASMTAGHCAAAPAGM